jgi:hypothetical protein
MTETNTSNGRFYGVVTGVVRPFREPGLDITDLTYGSFRRAFRCSIRILNYVYRQPGARRPGDLTSKATVTGLVGVMDFSSALRRSCWTKRRVQR